MRFSYGHIETDNLDSNFSLLKVKKRSELHYRWLQAAERLLHQL